MTELQHSYYLVRDHLGDDYFVRITGEPDQEELIEEVCDECGDNDWIEDEFSSYEAGIKAIQSQHYNADYRKTMIRKLYELD